jgi:pimeloyl-ACP methyl ester carboxylesterase
MLPVRNAELLREGISHAELHVLPGMGHGYNLEAQEQADPLVIEFVRRHGAAAGRAGEGTAHAVR